MCTCTVAMSKTRLCHNMCAILLNIASKMAFRFKLIVVACIHAHLVSLLIWRFMPLEELHVISALSYMYLICLIPHVIYIYK